VLADTWTVLRKELREVVRLYGGGRLGVLGLLAVPLVFGVLLPLQMGRAWVETPFALFFWVWLPPFLVLSLVADAVAGERERHTLESLLATRLTDGAILLGKIGAALTYACGVVLLGFGLGLLTVNIAHGRGELLLYTPLVVVGTVVLTLLVGGLAATGGVLLSLRAPTVRQVQQALGLVILVVAFVPGLAFQVLPPAWKTRLAGWAATTDPALALAVAAALLVFMNALLLAAAFARFRRARLIAG
jgi:ABC-2 type transport system permease protein